MRTFIAEQFIDSANFNTIIRFRISIHGRPYKFMTASFAWPNPFDTIKPKCSVLELLNVALVEQKLANITNSEQMYFFLTSEPL